MPRTVLVIVAVLFLAAASAFFATRASAVTVAIDQGPLTGASDGGVDSYKGIPYAASPVGALRWQAPQPGPHWSAPRDATAFGPACPQHITEGGMVARAKLPQNEDCLTLNVWAPTGAKNLPVMVWIHGGGFDQGSAALPLFNGAALAHRGVVLVSFNYRLGRLGFFPYPGLADANFGLLDQIAALKWVQRNIAVFGGDPHNVTIFGESAGGVAVDMLMTSPLAKGLFVKAISESGGLFGPTPKIEDGRKGALEFAAKLNAKDLAALRAASVDAILNAADYNDDGPVIDGKVLLEDPRDAFPAGHQLAIPYLTGSNSNEGAMLADNTAWVTKPFGDRIGDVRKLYDNAPDPLFGQHLFADRFMAGPTDQLAGAQSSRAPTWVYNFGFLNARARMRNETGVPHGGEMVFIWGFGPLAVFAPAQDTGMSDMMQRYWTNFAKTGNPNGDGLPVWRKFEGPHPQTFVIDDTPHTVPDFHKPQFENARTVKGDE
jgi:para-nitrobenzyl esterase